MERQSNGAGAGSCLGLLAVAAVSTSIILISYHLHRRLEADLRVRILGQGDDGTAADEHPGRRRRPRTTKKTTTKKKKVRFADDVAASPSSNSVEYRRRARAAVVVENNSHPRKLAS